MKALIAATVVLSGCSLANAIDVCDREGSVEREVNRRTEGDQFISSERALAPRPSGGAFVAWSSWPVGGTVLDSEVRGTLLGPDGAPVTTCDGSTELTIATSPAAAITLAPALGEDGRMLAAWVVPRTEGHEIWVRPIELSGCASGEAIRVDAGVAGRAVVRPSVVAMGDDRFVVLWGSVSQDPLELGAELWARVLDVSTPTFPRFLETVESPEGDAVRLGRVTGIGRIAAAPLGDARFAFAWLEIVGFEGSVRFGAWNDRLEEVFPTVQVADLEESRASVVEPALSLDHDGEQILVAWRQSDGEDAHRAFGRLFDLEGRPLRGALSDDGQAFRLGRDDASSEGDVTVVGAPGGGFVAAWTESGDIRAVWLDDEGGRRFANRACDRAEFSLNRVTEGDQSGPALGWLSDGSLIAAWTDGGGAGSDPSGTAVRAVALSPHDLLALE